ncbi:hypothetical protein [Planococcus plakortidis]|uniref:hypothetical protein n=1 Tax=Planococcus plakortidis TaxID=1038856 RepID=UPI00385E2374
MYYYFKLVTAYLVNGEQHTFPAFIKIPVEHKKATPKEYLKASYPSNREIIEKQGFTYFWTAFYELSEFEFYKESKEYEQTLRGNSGVRFSE